MVKLAIYYVGGATYEEEKRATEDGWQTYWTTDGRAHADAVRLSNWKD